MKLRPVNDVDRMYRCCRWCHHYQEGKCWRKDIAFNEGDSTLLYAADMGEFSEVIEETLDYPNEPASKLYRELNALLGEWKISKKKSEQFKDTFMEVYEEFKQDMRTIIDEAVLRKMNNLMDKVNNEFQGIGIESPEDFCCKYFE